MKLQSRQKIKIYSLPVDATAFDKLEYACAMKVQPYSTHEAGGGSLYIFAGEIKIRFADHENTSSSHDEPDYNIVDGDLDDETLDEIIHAIQYPTLVKKTVIAKHLGLTTPKLRKLLEPFAADCYEDICENEAYPNTTTTFVRVSKCLEIAKKNKITTRLPVSYGVYSLEDWDGGWPF